MSNQPRIFWLGEPMWEESQEFYERRTGELLSALAGKAAQAAEIAPGVRVLLLGVGGTVGPSSQVSVVGARVAVWHEADDTLADEWVTHGEPLPGTHVHCGASGHQDPGEEDDPPEPDDYDPGPEVDDEGGMSEYRGAFLPGCE